MAASRAPWAHRASPTASSPSPRAAPAASPAGRPSDTSRTVPRTPSPASRPTTQAATPQCRRPQRARLGPGGEGNPGPEPVDHDVAHGRHAARIEPLAELVHGAVGRGQEECRRRGARGGSERAVPEDGEDAELEEVPDLPDREVDRFEERRGGPRAELPEQRVHPVAGPAAGEEARRAQPDEAHPEDRRHEPGRAAARWGAIIARHRDRLIQPRCTNVDNIRARLLR